MANKKEETKKVNVTTVDEDNVMEQIRKGNLMPTTLHEKVKAEMEEEEEKKKIQLLKSEGVDVKDGKVADFSNKMFRFSSSSKAAAR